MLIDLQVFVTPESDPEAVGRQAKESSLDGVCLVGFKSLPSAAAVAAVKRSGLKVFVGAEVPLEKGHVLLFPGDAGVDWEGFCTGVADDSKWVEAAREKGFAVVACHPYHKESAAAMGDRIFQHRDFDAVIVVTGESSTSANDLALEAMESISAPAAGGTGGAGPQGRAATLFLNSFDSQAQLAEELKTGDFWAAALGPEDRWSTFGDEGEDRGRYGRRDDHRGGRGRERRGDDRRGGDRDRRGGGRDRRGSFERRGDRRDDRGNRSRGYDRGERGERGYEGGNRGHDDVGNRAYGDPGRGDPGTRAYGETGDRAYGEGGSREGYGEGRGRGRRRRGRRGPRPEGGGGQGSQGDAGGGFERGPGSGSGGPPPGGFDGDDNIGNV